MPGPNEPGDKARGARTAVRIAGLVIGIGALTAIITALLLSRRNSIPERAPTPLSSPTRETLAIGSPAVLPTSIPRRAQSEIPFERLSDQALAALPRREELEHLNDEELHHRPQPLQRASRVLGEIAQRLHDHPELAPEASRFYDECARGADIVKTVRALCLHDLDQISHVDPERYPEDVWVLARKLPRERGDAPSGVPFIK